MSFLSILALVFIVMKLAGLIDWSWLAVLAPLAVQFILIACLITVTVLKGK